MIKKYGNAEILTVEKDSIAESIDEDELKKKIDQSKEAIDEPKEKDKKKLN